jgi:hypothetical protein
LRCGRRRRRRYCTEDVPVLALFILGNALVDELLDRLFGARIGFKELKGIYKLRTVPQTKDIVDDVAS